MALAIATVGVPVVTAITPQPAQAATYGQLILDAAAAHQGKPYSYGATGPNSFDCSGFTGYIYRQFGVNLPRTSSQQYDAVQHLPQDQKQVGDLIFMYDGGGIYHVGLYAGNNQIFAATHSGDVVRHSNIWTSSYLVGRPALGGAIGAHWQALGGQYSVLGQAVNTEHSVPNAQKVDYQFGDIYWTGATGAREVHGLIGSLYDSTGGSAGYLGVPVSDEHPVAGGRASDFTGGTVYWGATGTHSVQGLIAAKYHGMGGSWSALGLPTGSEGPAAGGRVSTFQGGSIYWSPPTGANVVQGAIRDRYLAMGGPTGGLGLPVTDERATPQGRESVFQNGILRWNAANGNVSRAAR
jgi:uncharacterized protein with LGFP repeats